MMTLDKAYKLCLENKTQIVKVLKDNNRFFLFEKNISDGNLELRVFNEDDICIMRTCERDFICYSYLAAMKCLDTQIDLDMLVDKLSLDECIFMDDYDLYANLYKDQYFVWPCVTEDGWEHRVLEMRVKVYKSLFEYNFGDNIEELFLKGI